MESMKRITRNKEIIARKKAEKLEAREAPKKKRSEEKEVEKLAKEKRAKERDMIRREIFFEKEQNKAFRSANAENERRNKDIWTQDVLEECGKKL